MTSTQWTEYADAAKRITRSTVPTSDITAETVAAGGFTLRQIVQTGITQRFSRTFRADGMVMTQTDGRGNTTTTQADLLGRTVCVTDPTGAITTTRYDAVHNQPSVITDAMGHASCYRYDQRGRKTAEWGTAIQPAVFTYDDADRLTSLTTFRSTEEDISADPSERTDGDTTTWTYHDTTGLETRKTYADGSHLDKTYDAYNRLSVETLARGLTRTHRYEHARGLLLGTTYSDGTTARSYTYNHLGQMIQVVDDAGTRTIGYNRYGEQETDSLTTAEGVTHLITEARDTYGRNTGYTYSKDGVAQQTATTGYGSEGRIATAGFTHNGEEQRFTYSYLLGSDLLQQLVMPNGVTLTQTYEPQRNLLTEMAYSKDGATLASRSYRYDSLGRPTSRDIRQARNTRQDRFGYNTRSELTDAQLGLDAYRYSYDNIGNRKAAQGETKGKTTYTANALNQYTRMESADGTTYLAPTYDPDGNQTLVKTGTGVWSVEYNAENRPITFTRTEGDVTTRVTCTYDFMGRRATKKVETNGETTLHQRYLYRGYLQMAAYDLTAEGTPNLWYILWDPTQPIATRPLAICKDGTWYTYGWDLTKNICELFAPNGHLTATYTYTPYGEVTINGKVTQPIQWSSEFSDAELGLTYYNYRHYNPTDGRWLSRDPIGEAGGLHPSAFNKNRVVSSLDHLGLNELIVSGGCNTNPFGVDYSHIFLDKYLTYFTFSVWKKLTNEGFHDQNWANFITAAETEIKKRKEKLAPGEKIEWAVEYQTYKTRAINDSEDANFYLNQIRRKANELGVELRFYHSKQSLADIVNTVQVYEGNVSGTLTTTFMERNGKDKISRFVYFGHGSIGSIDPRYNFPRGGIPEQGYSITSEDIRKGIFKKGSFITSAVAISCACNSATPPKSGGQSFTKTWEGFFGSVLYGVNGRIKYVDPTKLVPTKNENIYGELPTWQPSDPDL